MLFLGQIFIDLMRVLEESRAQIYTMGKSKKHRIRKSKENEAEESSDEAASSNASSK